MAMPGTYGNGGAVRHGATVRCAETPRFPPPQRAVRPYTPGRRVAGTRVFTENRPAEPTCAETAGTPANVCVAAKAREMIVTWSPAVQPPATPLTMTLPPRRTDRGATVKATFTADARRLTSSPLATTDASPAPPSPAVLDALMTNERPRASSTQRHATPDAADQ
jgi:hypothetical protein